MLHLSIIISMKSIVAYEKHKSGGADAGETIRHGGKDRGERRRWDAKGQSYGYLPVSAGGRRGPS